MPITSTRARAARFAGAAALLACALGAAGCSSDSSRPDGGPTCRQGFATDCDAGTQCTNGNCVPTCASGACPAGTYCESSNVDAGLDVCSPIQTTACATDNDCPEPQSCAPGGICSSLELQANGSQNGCLLSSANDECAPDSLCYQVASGNVYLNYCVGLSHCSEDGGCPSATVTTGSGSVCNQLADGGFLFAGKERLCLYGFCVDNTHCPAGYACFHRTQGSQLGQCQDGLPGSPCYLPSDCFNSPTGCNVTLDGGFDGGQDDGGTLGTCY